MTVTVFCASSLGERTELIRAAEEVGKWIGGRGDTLVYGGGDAGFMGLVAKNAFETGAHVIGVLPGDIPFIRDRPQIYCHEVITARDLGERKQIMMERADLILALPGGPGTLDEITEAIDLIKLHKIRARAVCFDAGGFYEPLKAMLQNLTGFGFSDGSEAKDLLFSDDLEEIGTFAGNGGA